MSFIHGSSFFSPNDGRTLSPPTGISFKDPAIISTLPFDPYDVGRDRTEEVLQRTVKRWVWFDQALRIHPTLGTLSYFPLEIRRRIWDIVLHCDDTLSADGLWEYEQLHGGPLALSAYYFGFGRRKLHLGTVNGLRLVSSSFRAEYEDIFLSMRTFRFNRPESLDAFVNQLTVYQLSRLNSIAIGLSVCLTTSMGVWLSSMARLPSTLQYIHIRIYPARNGWFGMARRGQSVAYDRDVDQEDFDVLDALVKQAVRSAPNARVTICGAAKEYQLSTRCQVATDAIIANSRQPRSTA